MGALGTSLGVTLVILGISSPVALGVNSSFIGVSKGMQFPIFMHKVRFFTKSLDNLRMIAYIKVVTQKSSKKVFVDTF
jgi:hypothetical protein